jgi:hypothetical protein
MSFVDLLRDLDSFIYGIRDKEISDFDLETLLRELLSKYHCLHFRTIYRSVYYIVFVFECDKYTIEVRVEYCECNKVISSEYEILFRHGYTRISRKA